MAWERHWYRGNKVWILLDEAGRATLDDRGHAQLRYKPDDERTYTVRPAEIRPIDAGPATEAPTRKKAPIEAWVQIAPPTPEGQVGVGVLLAWRDRRREITGRLPAASDDEITVGAAIVALGAIRKPAWPVQIHMAAAERLEAIRAGAGTAPPACGEALRQAVESFADLHFNAVPSPLPADGARAAQIAGDALTG